MTPDWTTMKLNHSQTLMTKAQLDSLPALGSQDGKGLANQLMRIHFFAGGYDAYACEFDKEDGLFFGFVQIFEGCGEFGEFSAEEICETSMGMRFPIEREINFTPTMAGQIPLIASCIR